MHCIRSGSAIVNMRESPSEGITTHISQRMWWQRNGGGQPKNTDNVFNRLIEAKQHNANMKESFAAQIDMRQVNIDNYYYNHVNTIEKKASPLSYHAGDVGTNTDGVRERKRARQRGNRLGELECTLFETITYTDFRHLFH